MSDLLSTLDGSTVDAGPDADRIAQLLDPSINQLFAVTLCLTSMATEQVDRHDHDRLLGAVRQIDDAIRQLRHDLIAELVAARTPCDSEHVTW